MTVSVSVGLCENPAVQMTGRWKIGLKNILDSDHWQYGFGLDDGATVFGQLCHSFETVPQQNVLYSENLGSKYFLVQLSYFQIICRPVTFSL